MDMKRTAREWFLMIGDKSISQAALKAAEYENSLNKTFGSLPRAIEAAFIWRGTDEGTQYLKDIFEQASEGKL